ncbi:MAG: hypothetical protein IT305_19855 [Chloroflexi bacterium]|nr:hypothetical protein [Chloroflexota bacterium]
MAADHYRLPRPVGPSPGLDLGARRATTAEAVRAFVRARTHGTRLEAAALAGLWLVALAIRWVSLWTIPPPADEAASLLRALDAANAGAVLQPDAGITAADALQRIVFGGLFALAGPSPWLPRLLVAILAAASAPLTYLLTRELCRPLGRRRLEERFFLPRLAGLVAGGLLATSAAHVVLTSHTARASSLGPCFLLGGLFALERAFGTRDGRWLVPAGLLIGVAIQAHPAMLTLLPGLLLACWLAGRGAVWGRWLVPAALAILGAAAPLLLGLLAGDTTLWQDLAVRWSGTDTALPSDVAYSDALSALLGTLWQLLAGQIVGPATRPLVATSLVDTPLAWLYLLLAGAGLLVLLLRERPLLPLVALSGLLLLPYADDTLDPLLAGPALMPIVAIGMVGAGVAVGTLAPLLTRRGSLARLGLGVALGGLVLVPLSGLRAYYVEVAADGQTGDGLLLALRAIFDARRYDEIVLLDEDLAGVKVGAGGNALESLRYLLAASGIPTRTIRTVEDSLPAALGSGDRLVILERGTARSAAERFRLLPLLDDWIAPGRGGAAMVFRVERTAP